MNYSGYQITAGQISHVMVVQFGIILRPAWKQGNAEGMLLSQGGKLLPLFGMKFTSESIA